MGGSYFKGWSVATGLFVAGVVLATAGANLAWNRHALLASGVPVEGRVKAVEEVSPSHGNGGQHMPGCHRVTIGYPGLGGTESIHSLVECVAPSRFEVGAAVALVRVMDARTGQHGVYRDHLGERYGSLLLLIPLCLALVVLGKFVWAGLCSRPPQVSLIERRSGGC